MFNYCEQVLKCQLLFLGLLMFSAPQYGCTPVVPVMGYEYIQEADTWLRLHTVPATWTEARLRCHLEGGVLAYPNTYVLGREMLAMMAFNKLTTRSIFIGIHSYIAKGYFMTMDGIPLSKIPHRWADGEPNNFNNEEGCLEMTGTGELADVNCASVRPFFCRKESAKMTVNQCCTTDNEYKLENRTGSCYKFHIVPRIWSQAEATCAAEGGHLAVINSDTESQVLKELFAQHRDNTIRGSKNSFVAAVGFWDWNEHTHNAEWLTIFGETLAEAGFSKWAKNQPNNVGGIQHCGSINRDGLFNDIDCESKAAFICEITP